MRQFLIPCHEETRAPVGDWSVVSQFLERRGTPLELLPGESPDDLENRIGTRLMALYRDTRAPDCFDALYAFSGPAVLSWIRSLIGRELGHLDPQEILQDTFVNVYRYPGSFRADHPGSFRVWVRTIAGNVVRRLSNARSRGSFQDLAEEERELVDSAQGPVDSVSNGEQERCLKLAWMLFLCHYARAWRDLSQRDRRTLHLVEVEGLSYERAGKVLSVGRSNMKMIVFRSRKRIARRMRAAMSGARGAPEPELVA
jgi:RNA polymerase sigma factor (sigma-70 family)